MNLTLDFINLILGLFEVLLLLDIVWHTKSTLDKSGKFFLIGAVLLTAGIVLDLLASAQFIPAYSAYRSIRAIVTVFFFLGIYEMHKLVMTVGSVKRQNAKQKK